MTPFVVGCLAAGVLAGLFLWSAAGGVGLPYRLLQSVYYSFASLEGYQKSGRRYASATEIVGSQERSVADAIVGRIAPSQKGWLAKGFPTDKGAYHDYLRAYDALLAPYRTLGGVTLLEVGVKKGGSLALWRELLAEDAFVLGLDVHPGVPRFSRDARTKVLILDSRDRTAVDGALRGMTLDIIIDDGLHHPDAQRQTFTVLRPYLTRRGVYVIEDFHGPSASDYASFGDSVVVLPDRSGQSLVVLYPAESLAPRLTEIQR